MILNAMIKLYKVKIHFYYYYSTHKLRLYM